MSLSRKLLSPLVVLTLLVAGLVLAVAPPGGTPSAAAASRVPKDACRRIDPNLVNGACLRYRAGGRSGLTWIGTYRAPDGRVFFCIDFLYDSRLPRRAQVVSTHRIVNQLGERVGDREVAALNHVISTWAGHGSTGSDERDAAIALIIREVMGDGRRSGGTVVYPQGLEVGERVRPPVGGLDGLDARIMTLAQEMWRAASVYYGPYRLTLDSRRHGPVQVGRARVYRVQVLSAADRRVPGVEVRFACRGPVRCPRTVTSARRPVPVTVRPRDVGRYVVRAFAEGPSSDGLLYRTRHWHAHGGDHARDAGTQRGWIAQESRTTAVVRATARIRRARPEVVTQASEAMVTPGALLHDVVTVTGLPSGYDARVTATLHGPFAAQPGRDDCTADTVAGRVGFDVTADGTFVTPSVAVEDVGYYTWVESLPGDDRTVPVTTPCGLVPETTRVVPFTPKVSTTASRQRAFVGDALHDMVVLSGIEDRPVTVRWALHGPRPARGGSCAGMGDPAGWAGVPIAARGELTAAGDGRYRTTDTVLRSAGCYSYSQHVPPTPVTAEASSPPGLVPETALAERRTPEVGTVVSDQHALVGQRIHDTVRVGGLGGGDRVTVRWWLHGPLAPRHGVSCDGLRWAGAPVTDSGVFVADGNGTYETRGTLISTAGCYTYSERLAATAATEPARTEPGVPLETALATRPALPDIPEIPSGAAVTPDEPTYPTSRPEPRYLYRPYVAPSGPDGARRRPAGELRLDRIGLHAPVDAIGLDRGTMAIPNNRFHVGWLTATAAAGDLLGSSVVSGHVSDRHDRPGALWRLRLARVGDVVVWTEPGGEAHRFVVRSVRRYDRRGGLPGPVFRTDGPHVLQLVTCTNRRDLGGGAFHYADNLLVTAEEVE